MEDTMNYRVGYQRSWKKDLDKGGGRIIVELAGYVPVQRRIKEMMEAGRRLVEHRTAEAYYHYSTGQDPDLDFWDPTLEKGYDPADATQDAYTVKARLRAQKEAAKASKNQPEGETPGRPETSPAEAVKDK